MNNRPTRDTTWLEVCRTIARRSTCLRREVGCVLVDVRGHVLSTGYNGVIAGAPHCNKFEELTLPEVRAKEVAGNVDVVRIDDRILGWYPHACKGAQLPSGQGLDSCQAVHAEQNALLQCRDPWTIDTAYISVSPCVPCAKLLLSTSCKRVVFAEEYVLQDARELWLSAGREWILQRSTGRA